MSWFVYLVITSKNTLYCGYTINIEKRVATHNAGRGAKYTQKRLPVKLVYSEEFATKTEAMQREYAIKQMSRSEKLKLIKNT
jgi:putative endonuclease